MHLRSLGWTLVACLVPLPVAAAPANGNVPAFADLMTYTPTLKPELVGVHPRVFVTAAELDQARTRVQSTEAKTWQRALAGIPAFTHAPPPPPGPQERRSQNDVALAIAGASVAYAIDRTPAHLQAARTWILAAIDYEPWGYTFDKPNTDLAAGHLLYAIGWAYDLLYHDLTADERARIRASLERHADLVYDAFAPRHGRRFNFTQNHDFIPLAGLGVTALALIGESPHAERWATLARAHHIMAGALLSPDGYYYEGMEYWIFSATWLVHFLDAWGHATGEDLWDRGPYRNWKYFVAHEVMPDGQTVADFGDIWQGPLTRAKQGADYPRVYPTGTLESNFNVLYRVAARFHDPETQAVAERMARFGHTNQEEWWTVFWRDPALEPAPMRAIPLTRHFDDVGVVFHRTSWEADATAIAFKAGPPEGHRVTQLLPTIPEWRLSSGHAHPDAGSFIIFAGGHYLTGDTGYAGQPLARQHNTITIGGQGQGHEGDHDVWAKMEQAALNAVRITSVRETPGGGVRIEADLAGAYEGGLGVSRVTRVFTMVNSTEFEVDDTIATTAPKTVEWYLHADNPITEAAGRYELRAGSAALDVSIERPADSTVTLGPTQLMAPGKPGSITEGPQEARGYELKLQTPAATATHVHATLRVVRR